MGQAGVWREHQLAGHTCDVLEPATPHPQGFAVIYLDDTASRADSRTADSPAASPQRQDPPAMASELSRRGLRVVAPRGGRSWWTDKVWPGFDAGISAERYVLERVVADIAERWGLQTPAIGLSGVGMGGQGAIRLALKHPRVFPVVAAISPAIDYYQRWGDEEALQAIYADAEAARQDTATLHVHPLNWPRNLWFACDPADGNWYNGADKFRMKLGALGIPYECDLETSAGGDGPAFARQQAAKAVDFLIDRLEAESRRV